jgi:hypothetical protein
MEVKQTNNMTIEQQAEYLKIIQQNFKEIKVMLDKIEANIIEYPVYTQLAFIRPIKNMVFEAWSDSTNKEDSFLNNFNGGDDSIKV